MRTHFIIYKRLLAALLLLLVAAGVSADTLVDGGAVDYNMGAEGLYNMTEFVLVMMHYVTMILYCIASLTALTNALQIYIKMNNQEGDLSKSILMCVGSCLFLTIATFVLPGFFGVEQSGSILFSW